MPAPRNLTGQRFSRLIAIRPTKNRSSAGHIIWNCCCDCGNVVFVAMSDLTRGNTQSCGCLKRERTREANTGENHYNWRGGKKLNPKGYLRLKARDHPHSDNSGYVYEHRLVMEKKLGRYLQPDEVVHHIDENPANNDLSNLKLFSNNEEHLHHHRAIQNASTV